MSDKTTADIRRDAARLTDLVTHLKAGPGEVPVLHTVAQIVRIEGAALKLGAHVVKDLVTRD